MFVVVADPFGLEASLLLSCDGRLDDFEGDDALIDWV
jgi:hypothetical protein